MAHSDLLVTLFGGGLGDKILLVVNDKEDEILRYIQAAEFKVRIVG